MTENVVDRGAKAQEWTHDLAFGGSLDGGRDKYAAICGIFEWVWRKNTYQAHIFYNGYKRDDMPDEIMRADLELPVEVFESASVKDILEYAENTITKNGEWNDDTGTD